MKEDLKAVIVAIIILIVGALLLVSILPTAFTQSEPIEKSIQLNKNNSIIKQFIDAFVELGRRVIKYYRRMGLAPSYFKPDNLFTEHYRFLNI